jgi:hypothetical protein
MNIVVWRRKKIRQVISNVLTFKTMLSKTFFPAILYTDFSVNIEKFYEIILAILIVVSPPLLYQSREQRKGSSVFS